MVFVVFLTACSRCQNTYYMKASVAFRTSRGTTDMFFMARQVQEKSRERNKDLYMAFTDVTNAFNSNREARWKVNFIFGCPANYTTILRFLRDKMTATFLINGAETEPFTIRTGVKQGCVIAPTVFNIYLCAILFFVRHRIPSGVDIDYRFDGRLFNPSRLKAKTKVTKIAFNELQYADDCAILSHTAGEHQTSLDRLTEAYQSLRLSAKIRKTKIIFQPAPGNIEGPPDMKISGTTLEVVEHFPHPPPFERLLMGDKERR